MADCASVLPAALPEIFGCGSIALALLGTRPSASCSLGSRIGFLLMQSVEHQDVLTIMALTLMLGSRSPRITGRSPPPYPES